MSVKIKMLQGHRKISMETFTRSSSQATTLLGPTLSPQSTESTVEFIASETGKFALICLNSNCKTNDELNGIITITA